MANSLSQLALKPKINVKIFQMNGGYDRCENTEAKNKIKYSVLTIGRNAVAILNST